MSGYVDFAAIKAAVKLEDVCSWYNVVLKQESNVFRGCCPIHKGNDARAFVVNPTKQLWHCFGECKGGGDAIELVARIEGISQRDAALKMQERVAPPAPTKQPLAELDYLQPDHDSVKSLGVPAELAKRLGIGFANKGVLSGYVLFPLREPNGALYAYVGIHPEKGVKLPKNLKG